MGGPASPEASYHLAPLPSRPTTTSSNGTLPCRRITLPRKTLTCRACSTAATSWPSSCRSPAPGLSARDRPPGRNLDDHRQCDPRGGRPPALVGDVAVDNPAFGKWEDLSDYIGVGDAVDRTSDDGLVKRPPGQYYMHRRLGNTTECLRRTPASQPQRYTIKAHRVAARPHSPQHGFPVLYRRASPRIR